MKFFQKIKLDKYLFFLTVLSIVIIASVIRYALRTYKVPEWDEQHYMRMATEFYRLVKYHLSFSTPYDMLQIVPFRQPGYPLLILPFLLVFGLSNSYFWGIFTNGILYIATIFGIYFLAKNFLSKPASLLASVLFAFYGWTQLHLYLTYSETASSAFTVLSILFLIKSDLFRNKKYSIFFGIFFGLSLLVRWLTIEYVFVPLILSIFGLFKKGTLGKYLPNIALSLVISFALAFYPYFENRYWIFHYFADVGVGSSVWNALPKAETNPFSLYSLTFYLNTFSQLGTYFFLLIIAGFILGFKKKSKITLILLTALAGYIFSVLAPIKGERYIVPIFPYLAILSASVFDYIKNKKTYWLLILFTIALSLVSFLGGTWGKGPMKQSLASLPINLPFGQLNKIYLTTYSRPPYIYKISGKGILDFIQNDSKASGIKDPQVLSLFYYRPLDEPLMVYNLYNYDKPLAINNFLGTVIQNPDKESVAFIDTVAKQNDYILIKTGKRIDSSFAPVNYKTLKALIILFGNFPISAYYDKKAQFWINQDSSTVSVYKKKKDIPESELKEIESNFGEILKSY